MSEPDITKWRRYADQAKSGEIYLDDEAAARECLTACDKFIQDYTDLLRSAQNAQRVSGFGDFSMADDLTALFRSQATGEADSIDSVIIESIDVVKEMREVMLLSLNRITGQVVDHAAQISGVTNELGG
ncbi:hypothetical protein [Nocardia lijiangensis]|uniref:hypothetical protein n=1 Tax=Nocardia lijiangensis TaxID=299618 RepID=UPI0008340AF6|nr:hypothetical protein [Nocardia lijiangensis]